MVTCPGEREMQALALMGGREGGREGGRGEGGEDSSQDSLRAGYKPETTDCHCISVSENCQGHTSEKSPLCLYRQTDRQTDRHGWIDG